MKMLKIYIGIIFPLVLICFCFIISGNVTMGYSGFGIDSSDTLYIGTDTAIEKYDDGKKVGEINPQTSRGYVFTIQNDTILLSTASYVYNIGLDGTVISKEEETSTKTFNKIQREKNCFVASDGKEYNFKSFFGRCYIEDNAGTVIYKMPLLDYIVKVILGLVEISVFICVPIIVYKMRKVNK